MTMTTIMTKKLWLVVFALFVAVVYGYVIYELATFEHYDILLHHLRHLTPKKYFALFLVVLMSPMGALVESLRWRTALRSTERVGVLDAMRHVLNGWAAALVTPARIGEIPVRAVSVDENYRWQALASATLCSIMQSLVIISIGLWPAMQWGPLTVEDTRYYIVAWVMILLLWLSFRPLCRLINGHTSWSVLKKMTQGGASIPQKDFLKTLALTVVRYSMFCLQLFMMLRIMGITISVEDAVIYIPAYYLFVTLTPSAAVADAGVRGVWASVVFGPLSETAPMCILAAVLLWMINNFLPLLALIPLKKRAK